MHVATSLACAIALSLAWTTATSGPVPQQQAPAIEWNDNLEPAGTLESGVLELDLEIVKGQWRPLGRDEPAAEVLAFAEKGGAPSTPGPLIRVTRGTTIRVTLANRLDTAVVVRGFTERRSGVRQPLRVPARSTRDVTFTADVPGTYYYWGSTGAPNLGARAFEDSQLNGALIIDEPGPRPDDRVLMIGAWVRERLPDGSPMFDSQILVINGRPWPHTERMTYDLADTVHWRMINVSESVHAMHLHGFYYRIDARGDLFRDTVFWERGRRTAVTSRIAAGGTMAIAWSPDRPGGWLFHCHMSAHVVPNPPMSADPAALEALFDALYTDPHAHGNADHHAEEGMGGLVMGIYVRPPEGWVPNEPKRREMRLYINSAPAQGGRSGRQFAYVLQEGAAPPAADSIVFPSSTLVLRKGEPTSIRVFNRTGEPSQIHWHGLEIESYFDGVAGLSGYPEKLTPAIAPGDSFEIRITPPRAGSFMYHTHINDLRQQGSGLYGAFLVLEPDQPRDPDTDIVFLFGESAFRDDGIPAMNGANPTQPRTWRVGTTYRMRFMQITLNRPNTRIRLTLDGFPVRWTPVAKDGFDRPPAQRAPELADQFIAVGETYDYAYTPRAPGELTLELRMGNGILLVEQKIRIVQ